ncbi:hypothetical protein BDV29DRAFT_191598 [Aspergillus leporis]|uniref:RTA1 like protein-domain-containing protein n=1 Tax=Aspergillus leporis TaxID=41062 RepID=A0A5N5WYJ3_9EURO|nr:hypothetical protein BDV29DRAFT_191598 [Aspergillus leporis]
MANDQVVLGSLYVCRPNKGAAVFFAIAFAVSAVGHIWQCLRYKSFKLIGLHPVCAVVFTLGYAMRAYGAYDHYVYNNNKQTLMAFIISQVFIYVCPPLLGLANYHVLGRLFHYVPILAFLPPTEFFADALGVALNTNPTGSKQELEKALILVAKGLQLGVIAVVIGTAAIFHWRCARSNIHSRGVQTLLTTLNISMALILIRCIYRLWYFYIFEATLMLLNSILWNVWNLVLYLPQQHNIYLAPDGQTEVDRKKSRIPGRSSLGLGIRPCT